MDLADILLIVMGGLIVVYILFKVYVKLKKGGRKMADKEKVTAEELAKQNQLRVTYFNKLKDKRTGNLMLLKDVIEDILKGREI